MNKSQEENAVALAIWAAREETFERRLRRSPDSIDRESGAWDLVVKQARAAIQALDRCRSALSLGPDNG